MSNDLQVKFGIDLNALLQGMKRANKSLQDFKDQAARFKAALNAATDPSSIIRLNKALEATAAKIKAIESAGTKATTKGKTDFTGLSRVIQDLPFGFVGIQNNITQLLPAAGALGLVLSGVVSALTFAQVGTSAWTRGLKEAKKSTDDWKESQRSTMVEFEKQKATLESLVSVVKSDVSSKDQQARALEKLNKLIPDNIGVLTKQNITTAEGTKILSEYTKAIEARGIAELLSGRIAELSVQLIDGRNTATKELIKLQRAELNTQKEIDAARARGTSNNVATTGTLAALQTRLIDLQVKQRNLLQSYGKNVNEVTQQIANYRKEATAAFTTASPLEQFEKEKEEKKITTVIEVLQELRRELNYLEAVEIGFGTNEAKAKISAIDSAAKKLVKDFNIDPQDAIINKMLYGGKILNPVNGINIPGIEGLTEKLQEAVKRSVPTTPTDISIPVNLKLAMENNREKIEGAIAPFYKDITEEANAIGESMAEEMAAGFGENLGKLFAGQASSGELFAGIFQQLGNSLSQLGDLFIKTAIQIEIFKKLAITNPFAAIAAGIALKALGSFIKSKTQLPGFADGVTNFRGGLAMVGERGPELVRLPTGTDVIPNHSLGSSAIGGGMSVSVTGEFIMRNNILYAAVERGRKERGRVG